MSTSSTDRGQLSQQDRIVAVMGPTGDGKSTFIQTATGQEGQTIDRGLKPGPPEIRAVRVTHPIDDLPVVFVDTPGFDNTYMSDTEILTMIANWLTKTYKGNVNLATILYLHRITDNRMAKSSMKNLELFSSLCGSKSMPSVVIATTMWGEVNKETGIRREQQLTEFWKDILISGCGMARFEDTYDSAWGLIGSLADKAGMKVQRSKEIVDCRPGLKETKASLPQDIENVSREDRIVLVVGLTGAGKSTFVDFAIGQDAKTVGHGWQSCTTNIRAVRVTHPTDGRPVVFVDTPGFDNTFKSDAEILTMIAEWLVKPKNGKINLATILYLHRISDNRMSGSAMKNIRLFSSLCGQKAMPNVVIVTTMWSKVTEEEGTMREEVLEREVWKDMLGDGCKTHRFKDTYESAWHIVGSVMQNNSGTTLRIQEIGQSFKESKEAVPKSLVRKIRRGFSRLLWWNR